MSRRDSGVTLVEAVVAILILMLVLGGGIHALTSYARLNEAASRQIESLHVARATVEQLTRLDFRHAWLQDGTHALPSGAAGSYTVSRVPASQPHSSRKQVAVSVPWTVPGTGETSHETLTTVISEVLHP